MKKLYTLVILATALASSCTRCYTCSENGTGINSFKVCDGNPDYNAAKDAAKTGKGYLDADSVLYKCQ